MKKSLLLIAAAAALFAACTDNDSFKDIKNQKGENNNAITFATGSEKVTKAENSNALYTWTFFEHQSDFKVWGYKILDPNVAVFGEDDNSGTKVTVKKEDNGSYTYSYDENGTKPLRFWDKISPNYRFFAAAPANGGWAFTYTGATADPAVYGTGTFATTSILTGVNLQSVENGGASVNLKNTFKGKADVDKMIAAPCLVEQVSYNKPNPDAVHLNFIHILSKLNVTIATDLSTSLYEIKLLDFEVMNMPGKGKFDESKAAADQTAQNSPRWDLTGNTYNDKIDYLTGYNTLTDGVAVNGTKKYILESLVIPQNINYERVALDGKAHDEVDEDEAKPYTSYAAYEAAKHNDGVTRLTEAEFEALITSNNNEVVFVDWDTYKTTAMVPGQTNATITQEEFNSRVAEATKVIITAYSDYAEYAEAKGNNAAIDNEDDFNALFDNEGAFLSWTGYKAAVGDISEDDFNALVADATKSTTTEPYSSFTEYTTAKGNNATLNEAKFNALIKDGAFVDWNTYKTTAMVSGETVTTIVETDFNDRVVEATETPATNIDAYLAVANTENHSSEPYFMIKYSINGDVFTAYYNLVAAFNGLTNNETAFTGDKAGKDVLGFYEGWQNTLNIKIKPTAIEFTADVANWSDAEQATYEIEKGNY